MEFGLKLYLLFSILTFLNGYEYYDDMRAVKQKLLRNYNVDAVPKSTSNVSLVVNATLYVMALGGLDEKHQILSMSVFWVIRWQDVIFKWDITKYKNVKEMTVKVRDLWVPDVFVVNALKDMRVSRLDENEYVNALSDGHMTWYPSTELMTSCSVDISKYPFDIQVCNIRIESWYHNSKDFVLKPGNPGIDFSESHFLENGEWKVTNLTSFAYNYTDYLDNTTFYTGIKYLITLKRRSSYHLLTTGFPFFILMFLNTLSVIIPTECGEKLGFCMAQFLTVIVFLTLVAQSMPVSSLTISHFTLIIASQILISGFSTLIVAVSIYFQNKSENKKPPLCLQILLTPVLYLQNVTKNPEKEENEEHTITWKHLDERVNCILRVVLFINIGVSISLYAIFVLID